MANWQIVDTIDEGGFGKVHEVKNSVTGQKGALKELKSSHTINLARFQTEIKILQNYNHPHIITIYDSNINGSPPYGPWYIMEYMGGGSLKTMMYNMFNVRKQLFSKKWTLQNVILPTLEALQYAHSHNIHPAYYRDIKPANLLFTEANHIKVADWGIGKDINRTSIALTVGGIGTPGYCSPEQWFANAAVDARTDIYSLGIIFYEMMTGKLPQVFNNTGQRFSVPTPSSQNHPTISLELNNAILKMINYEQRDRYQTISQVKEALTLINRSIQ